jgi:heat shock protein HslJ
MPRKPAAMLVHGPRFGRCPSGLSWTIPALVLLLGVGATGCVKRPPQGSLEDIRNRTELVGTVWSLQNISPPGQQVVTVSNPEDYILQFLPGGVLAVRADCNTCRGVYVVNRPVLQMDVDCATQGCRPGSRAELFLEALRQIRKYSMSGDQLYLSTLGEGGVLTLGRMP